MKDLEYTFTKQEWDEAVMKTVRFVCMDKNYFNPQNAQGALTAVELFKDLLLIPTEVPKTYKGFKELFP